MLQSCSRHRNCVRIGADICGKPFAIDTAIYASLNDAGRCGGMATNGTREDPHIINITGDGMTKGVIIGHFPGSTEYLNQSSTVVA